MRPNDQTQLLWVYEELPVGILYVHVIKDWLEQVQLGIRPPSPIYRTERKRAKVAV